jgi:hypothetical protein
MFLVDSRVVGSMLLVDHMVVCSCPKPVISCTILWFQVLRTRLVGSDIVRSNLLVADTPGTSSVETFEEGTVTGEVKDVMAGDDVLAGEREKVEDVVAGVVAVHCKCESRFSKGIDQISLHLQKLNQQNLGNTKTSYQLLASYQNI